MRIVQGTDTPASRRDPDLGRVAALEKIVKSVLQRLQSLEVKLGTQENASNHASPAPDIGLPSSAASLDTEAVKKGLLSKMWKYLNDERSSKAA